MGKVKEHCFKLRVGCDIWSRVQIPARRTEPLRQGESLPQKSFTSSDLEHQPIHWVPVHTRGIAHHYHQIISTLLRQGHAGADAQRTEDVLGLTKPLSVNFELELAV
jgi:hypothetical protein